MYCPQCGSEASSGLQYCRSCGLALNAVEAALGDGFSAAASELRHGARAIKFSLIWMGLFVVIAGIAAAAAGPFDVTIGPLLIRVSDWGVSLMLGLLVGMPAVGLGYRRIRHAAEQFRELDTTDEAEGGRGRHNLENSSARMLVGDGETRRIVEIAAGSEEATERLKRSPGKDQ